MRRSWTLTSTLLPSEFLSSIVTFQVSEKNGLDSRKVTRVVMSTDSHVVF